MSKNCDEYCFLRFTWDKGGMPTVAICNGKNVPREEAIVAVNSEECDMYEKGHEIYKKQKEGKFKILIGKQQYITDRRDCSKEPVAICGSYIEGDVSNCHRGENGYCYCRLECTGQTELNGSGKMLPEMRKTFGAALAKGISMKREEKKNE